MMERSAETASSLNTRLSSPVDQLRLQDALRESHEQPVPTALESRLELSQSSPNFWQTVGRHWKAMEIDSINKAAYIRVQQLSSRRQQVEPARDKENTRKSARHDKHRRRIRRNYLGDGRGYDGSSQPRTHRRLRRQILVGAGAPPINVHLNDWREMLALIANAVSAEASHRDCTSPQITNGNNETQCSEGVTNKSEYFPKMTSLANAEEGMQLSSKTLKIDRTAGIYSLTGGGYLRARTGSLLSLRQNSWIEQVFKRRECSKFIATTRYPDKCCCGRIKRLHFPDVLRQYSQNDAAVDSANMTSTECKFPMMQSDDDMDSEIGRSPATTRKPENEKWTIRKHTTVLPTNAYGTIEFQGGPHPFKARYLRLNVETDPADVMNLFENVWQIPPPKLIITVHGGTANFHLQPKLARMFRKGILKAARTTGAWIITSGTNAGVVRHVAAALEESMMRSPARSKIVTIGITSWGLLKKRDSLLGQDVVVPYHPHSFSPKGRFTVLNKCHSYFLLVDNGTVGRNGADVLLRKRLEMHIAEKQKMRGGTRSVPVVCVVLEGGTCTIRAVLDYVTNSPQVPVVVCDGSGRAADLLAFAHQYLQEDGLLPEGIKPQLLNLIQNVFGCDEENAEKLLAEIVKCARQKHLMTVFRLGEKRKQDIDHAILTALLKEQNLSPSDQLALALAWNRVDIARSEIFVSGQEWPKMALHNAMMEALVNDRVDFVRLLLENGVSMHDFLTIDRLEELYNTDKGPQNTLYYIIRDIVKLRPGFRYTLPHIGLVIEKLMGNTYKSTYTSDTFREKSRQRHKGNMRVQGKYEHIPRCQDLSERTPAVEVPVSANAGIANNLMAAASSSRALSNHILWRTASRRDDVVVSLEAMGPSSSREKYETVVDVEDDSNLSTSDTSQGDFKYPFSELFLWAVLTKRHEMALCMWQHGEDAMAKALVACRLYKSLAEEAAEDYLEVEIRAELIKHAEEFRKLSLELLEHSYQQDDAQTLQLLTYELTNWGNETCLSLAVMNNNKPFLSHPCCQILLADLWHGGLRMRSSSNLRVLCGLFFPPSIFFIEFKSREELMLQPQTAAEHEDDINDSSSSSSSSEIESSDFDYSTDADSLQIGQEGGDKRMNSISESSVHSSSHAGIFQGRRKRTRVGKDKGSNATLGAVPVPQVVDSIINTAAIPLANNAGVAIQLSSLDNTKTTRAASVNSQHSHLFSGPRKMSSRHNSVTKALKRERHHHRHHRQIDLPLNVDDRSKSQQKVTNEHNLPFGDSSEENEATKDREKRIVLQNLPRERPIKLRRKLYEFYVAPITTFWAWALSFCLFMCCTTYSLLVRTIIRPRPVEWFIFIYVVTFGMEHARKFLMSEPKSLNQKAKYFFRNVWNMVTTTAVITYLIGFAFRLNPPTRSTYGRLILACNSVLWSIKLLDFLSVHPRMGPYITMAAKMIQSMVYIVVLLCIALMSFGLARQSISYPNEDWHWMLLRNVFYKPYYMLYGEVYADEIDACGDEAWDRHLEDGIPIDKINSTSGLSCVPGHWMPPILMTAFLLIANILLISMLIATFNNIFDRADKMSKEIWMFERYRQVMEYESTSFLPPPLTPIYYLWMVIKYIRINRGCRSRAQNASRQRKNLFDFTLKLFLDEDQVKKLHDFEEDCMEDLAREKDFIKNTSTEERIQRIAERSDLVLARVNDVAAKETAVKNSILELDGRLRVIESQQKEILDYLRQLMCKQLPANASNPQQFGGATRKSSGLLAAQIDENVELCSLDSPAKSTKVTTDCETSDAERTLDTNHFSIQILHETKSREQTMRRMRTSTVTGCDEFRRVPASVRRKNQRFGSVSSLDPKTLNRNVYGSLKRRNPCSSLRRPRRHDEYTSITDAINLTDVLPKLKKVTDEDSRYDDKEENLISANNSGNEDGEIVDDDYDVSEMEYQRAETPTTALLRAKQGFVTNQNTVLKECEEEIAERLRDTDVLQSPMDAFAKPEKAHREFEYNEPKKRCSCKESELGVSALEEGGDSSGKEYIEFSVIKGSESASLNTEPSTSSQPSLSTWHELRKTSDPLCLANISNVSSKVELHFASATIRKASES